MIAFHGIEEVKETYVNRVKAHALADEIIQGTYWENGKGCAVGCTVHSDQHDAYEDLLGIPETLAWIEDRIFEGLDNKDAKSFPLAFIESIHVGADLSLVTTQFVKALLSKYVRLLRGTQFEIFKSYVDAFGKDEPVPDAVLVRLNVFGGNSDYSSPIHHFVIATEYIRNDNIRFFVDAISRMAYYYWRNKGKIHIEEYVFYCDARDILLKILSRTLPKGGE